MVTANMCNASDASISPDNEIDECPYNRTKSTGSSDSHQDGSIDASIHSLRRRLACRNISVLCTIFLIQATFVAWSIQFIELQDHLGAIINLSGRQRMMSQRSMLLVYRLLDLPSTYEARVPLQKTILALLEEYKREHVYLSTGSDPRAIFDDFDPASAAVKLYFDARQDGSISLDQAIKQLLSGISMIARNDSMDMRASDIEPKLKDLNLLSESILDDSNTNTKTYESIQDSNRRQLFLCIIIFSIVLIGTLLLVAICIFGPTVEFIVARTEQEQNRSQTAQREVEYQKGYLNYIAHELRTPLTGMIGLIECLTDLDLPDKSKSHVLTLLRSASTLETIINNVLDMSRIRAGRMECSLTATNCVDLLERVRNLFRARADEKKLLQTLEIPPSIRNAPFFEIDELKTEQIIRNLYNNAVKFSHVQGAICLKMSFEEFDGRHWFNVDVSDNGPGISCNLMPQLFEFFRQADPAIANTQGGSGLGLAISRELAIVLGGRINVSSTVETASKPGSTCFSLQVPTKRVQAINHGTEANEGRTMPLINPFWSTLRVVAADDHAINRKVLASICDRLGIKVGLLASDGAELVEKLSRAVNDIPDFIFLDLHMPVLDGLGTLKKLRELYSRSDNANHNTIDSKQTQRRPRIVVMTAAPENSPSYYISLGFDDFLPKPFKSKDLSDLLYCHIG